MLESSLVFNSDCQYASYPDYVRDVVSFCLFTLALKLTTHHYETFRESKFSFISLSCKNHVKLHFILLLGASECPQNIRALKHLHVYSDSCLVLVRNQLTWKDALTSCRKTGGELVMIKDADKQAFILKALSADHWDQDQVWIGASDLQHEGDWRWVDGM